MNRDDFVNETIADFNSDLIKMFTNTVFDEYLSFVFVEDEDITNDILCEKICDHIEKIELKTGKNFDKLLRTYMDDMDAIIDAMVAKTPPAKKSDPPAVTPRARKYYEKAITYKKRDEITTQNVYSFSRIMMCLYSAIIKEKKIIDNFDYSISSLDIDQILTGMKKEEISFAFNKGKKRFNLDNSYSDDASTFIIAIIMLCRILNNLEEEEE